jgi:hypothetical protein
MATVSPGNPPQTGPNQQEAPARRPVVYGVLALGLAVIAGVVFYLRHLPSAQEGQASTVAPTAPAAPESTATAPAPRPVTPPAAPGGIAAQTPAPSPATTASTPATAPKPVATNPPLTTVPRTEASPYTRGLVGNLAGLDLSGGSITPEKAQFWKDEYAKLLREGAGAVPAIRDFLEKNVDVNFASVQGGDQLGASSLRLAMLDALRQIGGPEALGVSAQLMLNTSEPREIAILARNLDAAAPDQYRDTSIAAARIALAKAAQNPALVDTSPLFEVLQKVGGAGVLSDLELAAPKWNYYGPMVLASLPEGAGVPALTRLAQNADGTFSSSGFAWQMLAQMAPQYPDAAKALLDQVSAGKLPDSAWTGLASALSGTWTYYGDGYLNEFTPPANATEPKSYHINGNQQNYRSVSLAPSWTPEQVQKQLALIDQLRAANPTANRMLEGARNALAGKPGP